MHDNSINYIDFLPKGTVLLQRMSDNKYLLTPIPRKGKGSMHDNSCIFDAKLSASTKLICKGVINKVACDGRLSINFLLTPIPLRVAKRSFA